MLGCRIDYSPVEFYYRTGLTLEKFTFHSKLAAVRQSLDMLRHLIEIYIQADAEHALLRLYLLE